MAQVRLVLVRPENSSNVGAVARVIANMGLEGLDLVEPYDWHTLKAWRMAWRAEDILEQARVFGSLREAVADRVYVAGLAGRAGTRVEPITPKRMASEIAALGPNAPAAIVLGCESKGLSEDELCHCQRRVRIPSHPRQPSLNLAQAAMVAAYEVFLGASASAEISPPRATSGDIEWAFDSLKDALLQIGFLPPENPEARFVEWREFFGRAGLSPREVRIILAFARRIRNTARIARKAKPS